MPEGRSATLSQRLATWLEIVVPAALFAWGMWSFPIAVIDPSRELLPGDLGDSRFNNYILEHFHQYTSGATDSYWDGPFMEPYPNTIALSDNLLGTAPMYSLFRGFGFNRESAYQIWFLAVFALNFLCCYGALLAWTRRSVASACGAYVFAFGLHMIGHMDHAQVFPKFMVPLAICWFWRWLEAGSLRHLLLAALAVVYQFYCGIYLGFILLYMLACISIAHLSLHWRERRRYLPVGNRPWVAGAGIVLLSALLLAPLLMPYWEVSSTLGTRPFDAVKSTIPRPEGYFFTHPGAINWRSLSSHSQYAFDDWWSQFHFMGALPWLALLTLPFSLRCASPGQRMALWTLVIGLGISLLFCLRIGDFTLYGAVHALPGFSALRAIDRFVPVQAMLFAAVLAFVVAAFWQRPELRLFLALLLPVATVLDNKVDVRELKRYDKHAARERVERAVLDIGLVADSTTRAVAYASVRGVLDFGPDHDRTIVMHLTAMLAGQELGIPVVNAYTGSYPGNYMAFWDNQDERSLRAWYAWNNTGPTGVLLVNNLHEPVLSTDTVHLQAANGRFVRVEKEGNTIADSDSAYAWQALARIQLHDGVAFVTPKDRLLAAALHADGAIVAKSDRLGDMAVFREVPLPDGMVALRAHDGRYWALDTISLQVRASADSLSVLTRFRVR